MEKQIIRRGDIWFADILPSYHNGLRGKRPVIVLSNWKACNNSPLINVIPVTSNIKTLPSHVLIDEGCGLSRKSIAVCEQVSPIPRENLLYQLGKCSYKTMQDIKAAINIQFGFKEVEADSEVNMMLTYIEELNRFLRKSYNLEILQERNLAIKSLECYCINHSIHLDTEYLRYYQERRGLDDMCV